MIHLVGIHGKIGAGKDTVGSIIKKQHPTAIRLAFADELKNEVARNYGVTVQHIETCKQMFRPVLQAHGELMRQLKGADYWVEKVMREFLKLKVEDGTIVYITDVRHLNEAAAIKDVGGWLWKVERFTSQPMVSVSYGEVTINTDTIDTDTIDKHPSEVALDNHKQWDAIIHNNGTIQELEDTVKDELSCII